MMRIAIASGLSLLLTSTAFAEATVERKELSRAPVPGSETHEVVVSRVSIPPGARIPLHTHPGDEHAVVLVGGPVMRADGTEAVMPDGIAFHFPEGMVHGGLKATGDAPLDLVTTHVVRIGEPITVLAE